MNKFVNEYGWTFQYNFNEKEYVVEKHFLDKFSNDRVFLENNEILILIDGVIYNRNDFLQNYQVESWQECVRLMYFQNELFYAQFRGSFNGLIYDKVKNLIIAFGDHVGERPLFYFNNSENFIVSSNYNRLFAVMESYNIKRELNVEAVKYMLSYGGMLDNSTYCENVYRLLWGEYITLNLLDFTFEKRKYFDLDNETVIYSDEEEAIEALDSAFRTAIKREFDKDLEYGYNSLVDISGGMDSRTVCFVAKDMGYENVTNICMSQMNAYERAVAEENVKILGNDYIFSALDNASFIEDVDDIVRLNYGLTYVGAVSGALKNTKLFNMNRVGIHHTGILGDVHDGSFVFDTQHEAPFIPNRYKLSSANDFTFNSLDLNEYANQEMYLFKTRGILFGLSSNFIRRSSCETYSPFCDVDFLNVFFKMPLEFRTTKKVLQKWVLQKYPVINKVVYSNTGSKMNTNIYWRKFKSAGRRLKNDFIKPAMSSIHLPVDASPKNSMNPFQYWYETKPNFKSFVEDYYLENKNRLQAYPEVFEYCTNCYSQSIMDKLLAMTVISVIKQYFSDN